MGVDTGTDTMTAGAARTGGDRDGGDMRDIERRLDRIEGKLDTLITEIGNERVKIEKNRGRISGVYKRVEKIEAVRPVCDTRFRALENGLLE